MKKLRSQQKKHFENPIENFLDLFRFISREINSDGIWIGESSFKLKRATLLVELDLCWKGTDVFEELEI